MNIGERNGAVVKEPLNANGEALLERIEHAQRGSTVAAIFDVDGVLVNGNSGVALTWALITARSTTITASFHALAGAALYALGSRARFATFDVIGRLIKARPASEISSVAVSLAIRILRQPKTGHLVPRLLDRHLMCGHLVVLASAAPRFLVDAIAQILGASQVVATEYEIDAGIFTGELAIPPPVGEEKLRRIRHLAAEKRFRLDQSFAYCNDFSDLHLLDAVMHPTVIRPDPRLAQVAAWRGW